LKSATFKYKLQGYDRDWRYIDRDNLAFYTNIPPGSHELLVQVANSDGVYNEAMTALEFRVQYPYWQTWWFYTLGAMLSALLIYGLIYWRSRRIRAHRDRLRREVETQTRELSEQKEELEFVNKELQAFSYTVSHDMRAPIYRILNYCEFLEDDHAKQLNDEGNLFISKIKSDASKANQLVENLLALSRVEKLELSKEKFDLITVTKSVLSNLMSDIPKDKIKLTLADEIIIVGDISLMTIAMENLLSNAIKFTSKTASPEISVIETTYEGQNCICVMDNGAGFEQEKASALFEPFERLHAEKEFRGTGVGLATVRRVIKRHGGWIKARGEVGRGAAFYFSF
jgi:signal transduction histidine kinase